MSPSPSPSLITIRRATPNDVAAYLRIMSDPDVLANLMQLPYPSEEVWRQRIADNNLPGKTDLSLVAELGGEVVGSAGLHPAGPAVRRRHVAQLGISVISTHHGQGVGTALMRALCDYADNWAHVLRIELTVYVGNARAIALYRRFGFVHEGTHRGFALRAGAYVDALSMARIHPNPPTLQA